MIVDENGKKWPETIDDEVKLREQSERYNKAWNRKAAREGWGKPVRNQGTSRLDKAFARKAAREGWG